MTSFNLTPKDDIVLNYQQGLLPQRNLPGFFYKDTSCRSNLNKFLLSSENRRIIKKTADFSFTLIPLPQFKYTIEVQKQIFSWIKKLGWDFPISSVKNVFCQHIFNYVYIWSLDSQICAYTICYFSHNLSHVAYVFYDPKFAHSDLPIRLSLQTIIDSHSQGLQFCYLGRFDISTKIGYYKRNFPGFEYFDTTWKQL